MAGFHILWKFNVINCTKFSGSRTAVRELSGGGGVSFNRPSVLWDVAGPMTMYWWGTEEADHHVRIKYCKGRWPCTDKVPQGQITKYVVLRRRLPYKYELLQGQMAKHDCCIPGAGDHVHDVWSTKAWIWYCYEHWRRFLNQNETDFARGSDVICDCGLLELSSV